MLYIRPCGTFHLHMHYRMHHISSESKCVVKRWRFFPKIKDCERMLMERCSIFSSVTSTHVVCMIVVFSCQDVSVLNLR